MKELSEKIGKLGVAEVYFYKNRTMDGFTLDLDVNEWITLYNRSKDEEFKKYTLELAISKADVFDKTLLVYKTIFMCLNYAKMSDSIEIVNNKDYKNENTAYLEEKCSCLIEKMKEQLNSLEDFKDLLQFEETREFALQELSKNLD